MRHLVWYLMVGVLTIATFTDLRSRRIPNWLVFPVLLGGIAFSTYLQGSHGLGRSLEGIALGTAFYGTLYYLGGLGMGDVKLCAAIGAWIGPQQLMLSIVMTALFGGLMAIGWAIAGNFVGELLHGTGKIVLGMGKRGFKPHPEIALSNRRARKMPYAPAIAFGTLLSFFAQ
jgi:prepilin peptidase CpaA